MAAARRAWDLKNAGPAPDDEGFAPHDVGTYGKIAYNRETGEVRKTMRLTAEPRVGAVAPEAEYAVVCELATHAAAAAAGIRGVPRATRVRLARDEGLAEIYMPYAGETLHRWLQRAPLKRRRACAAAILREVARAVMQLAEIGVQNTDLKPTNVLIREPERAPGAAPAADGSDLEVRLIDFNLVSMRAGRATRWNGYTAKHEITGTSWTPAFGTWCYCAPEVLADATAARERSPAWALGLLLAVIVARYPYDGYAQLTAAQLNSRKFWKAEHARLRAENPQHLPLPADVAARMSATMRKLFAECTAWDPDKRPTLRRICQSYGGPFCEVSYSNRPMLRRWTDDDAPANGEAVRMRDDISGRASDAYYATEYDLSRRTDLTEEESDEAWRRARAREREVNDAFGDHWDYRRIAWPWYDREPVMYRDLRVAPRCETELWLRPPPFADDVWRTLAPRDARVAILRELRAFGEAPEHAPFPKHVLVAAMLYVDRAATCTPTPERAVRLAGAALHMALLYYDQYIYDRPSLPASHPLFADHEALWALGEALGWRLYVPHKLLCFASDAARHGRFCDRLLALDGKYTCASLLMDIKPKHRTIPML